MVAEPVLWWCPVCRRTVAETEIARVPGPDEINWHNPSAADPAGGAMRHIVTRALPAAH